MPQGGPRRWRGAEAPLATPAAPAPWPTQVIRAISRWHRFFLRGKGRTWWVPPPTPAAPPPVPYNMFRRAQWRWLHRGRTRWVPTTVAVTSNPPYDIRERARWWALPRRGKNWMAPYPAAAAPVPITPNVTRARVQWMAMYRPRPRQLFIPPPTAAPPAGAFWRTLLGVGP